MSEILLQTIIEKVEAFEITLLRQVNPNDNPAVTKEIAEQMKKIRSGLDGLCTNFDLINERIIDLNKRLDNHNTQFQQPVSTKIEPRHHLLFSTALFMTVLFVTWAWLTSYESKKSFEANDIKYRALKITDNKVLLDLLYKTDSLYQQNGSAFREYIVDREKQLLKQAEMSRIADENKKKRK